MKFRTPDILHIKENNENNLEIKRNNEYDLLNNLLIIKQKLF